MKYLVGVEVVRAADRRFKRVVFRRRVVVVMVGLRPQRQRGHVEDSFLSLSLSFFFLSLLVYFPSFFFFGFFGGAVFLSLSLSLEMVFGDKDRVRPE